mmetsp:Transcript_44662/g.101932  ORF Transcript_44662/g.101932 Transcript_44662/m.101932 type:complete len:222 (-) Transcript_44662:174-839(-)
MFPHVGGFLLSISIVVLRQRQCCSSEGGEGWEKPSSSVYPFTSKKNWIAEHYVREVQSPVRHQLRVVRLQRYVHYVGVSYKGVAAGKSVADIMGHGENHQRSRGVVLSGNNVQKMLGQNLHPQSAGRGVDVCLRAPKRLRSLAAQNLLLLPELLNSLQRLRLQDMKKPRLQKSLLGLGKSAHVIPFPPHFVVKIIVVLKSQEARSTMRFAERLSTGRCRED